MRDGAAAPPGPAEMARLWLLDGGLQFWATRAFDSTFGGCVEALTIDGLDAEAAFKRTRVAWRQIYVFAHAACEGYPYGLDDAVRTANWMWTRAWRGDGAGFVRVLTRDGGILDPTIDLYDNAFAIFALAWLYRATGQAQFLRGARRALAATRKTLLRTDGLSYWSDESRSPELDQNPHMHLYEACVEAASAFGEEAFFSETARLNALFDRSLYDGASVAELYRNDYRRLPTAEGGKIMPGHLFEWAWLLAREHQCANGKERREEIANLCHFAEAFGITPTTGLVANEITVEGAPIDPGTRAWNNAERVKGLIAVGGGERVRSAIKALVTRHLLLSRPGMWRDAIDGAGAIVGSMVPASSLYHLVSAILSLPNPAPSDVSAQTVGDSRIEIA